MDVIAILKAYHIPYVTFGRNVAVGNVNVKCPICGELDKSEHLGINLETGVWGCWRNRQHRSPSFPALLVRLLGITYDEAEIIIAAPPTNELFASIPGLLNPVPEELIILPELVLPDSFKLIKNDSFGKPFYRYLLSRGFPDVEDLISHFPLYYTMVGDFKSRVIFPFYLGGKLRAWSGRAIVPATIRYRSFPLGNAIKQTILSYDYLLSGGRRLYLVEGPFDALKINYYSRFDKAAPFLGTSFSTEQLNLLLELLPEYEEIVILVDSTAFDIALELSGSLAVLNPRIGSLPTDVKDPGELNKSQILAL